MYIKTIPINYGNTDSDGLDDHTEVNWGTNPLVADADADIDGDGLTNYEEIMGIYDFNGDGDYDDPGEYTGYHTFLYNR